MSAVTSSGIQRHRQHAYEVGTNKHNKYGLNYGYSVNPDPNNPYGWQAYEAERAQQKKQHADMQAAAAASQLQMQMAAGMAPITASGIRQPSSPSSSSVVCTSLSSSVPESSCSTSPSEKKKKKKKEKEKEKEKKKRKGKCSGTACRMKSLRVRRPGPHWCDGKKWGGKIWGMTRDPGDKNPDNWGLYFDPKLSKSDVIKICRRRCPPSTKHHKTVETKVIVTRCCHGPGCPQCQTAVSLPVPDAAEYGGAGDAGDGVMAVDLGPGPSMPPHPGYSGHPAGNVERWRVHTAANTTKEKSKSGSSKSSKSSKSGSKKSSGKTKYSFYGTAPKPQNKGFDNRFLFAGKDFSKDGGSSGAVRAGGNYARVASGGQGPSGGDKVEPPAAHRSPSSHGGGGGDGGDPVGHVASPEPEQTVRPHVGQNTGEDAGGEAANSSKKSSKGKGKEPDTNSCWVESPESAGPSTSSYGVTTGSQDNDRESRFDRFRSRRDDSGRVRDGSWERVSPQVQREREWQRLQDEERGRLEREAEAEADAEQDYPASLQKVAEACSPGSADGHSYNNSDSYSCTYSYSYPDFDAAAKPPSNANSSSNTPTEYLTLVDSSYFAHMDDPTRRRTGSGTMLSNTKKPASSISVSCSAISSPYSISGDTGYETGHEADSEAHRLSDEAGVYEDPGYGSMHESTCDGYGSFGTYGDGYSSYADYGHGHDGDDSIWAGLESSSTTLLSSRSPSASVKARSSEKGDDGKGKGSENGKKSKGHKSRSTKKSSDKQGRAASVASGGTAASGRLSSRSGGGESRDNHRSKKSTKSDGGLLAKIVGW
ncbi:hypothetical protein F503_00793 [Ophiostoma piceae UAMH 11346]|uniref:Uncharacterized protein n=1 Tax=Ophiostoma piceae (strain UAMH 11346) TaxID=1262450 RepID=S3D3S4_OPHP1|nr:hypothetical protein F503_00793 [Ophiostoma piceae UAMH 11346]